MAAPQFLVHAADGWARLYANTKPISIAVTYLHLAGLLLGGGAAVAADRRTLRVARESDSIRAAHLEFLGSVHTIAIAGLVMIVISGAAMFFSDLATFWSARAFWIKMGMVVVLLANGLVMRRAEASARTEPAMSWRLLQATSLSSLALWFAILLASLILASS